MASSLHSVLPFPPPTLDEATALVVARAYLVRVGTQTASQLLGRPGLDGDAVLLADLSDRLLDSAALCTALLELAEWEPQA